MTELPRNPLRRSLPLVVAGFCGFLSFVVYVLGVCRTIYAGDSGDLATAVATLGIAHPTGYPLYILLGKLWTLMVPIGSVAFRLSLLSALCAAVAVGLLTRLCLRLGLHPVASASSALLVAFAPSFWSQANVQRVYSLNALFVVLATAAALRWYHDKSVGKLAVAFLICGLGASNHSYMAVYGITFAIFVVLTEPAVVRKPRAIAASTLAFGAGLLPYLYLPIRSRQNPVLDWGNPETLSSFLDVVLRRDFWQRAWLESAADLVPIGADYGASLAVELYGVGAVMALVGLAYGVRRRLPVGLFALVMATNLGILAVHGSRIDIFVWHRYYVPSYLMAAILAAMGWHVFLSYVPKRLSWLPFLVPLFALLAGFRDFDRSRYRIAEDFSETLLQTLPPGAHLSASDDNILFVLMYLHYEEGLRPDLDLILQGVDNELPPLRFDPDDDPLFFTHHPNWKSNEVEAVPVGLVFRTVRSGAPPPPLVIPKVTLDGEHDPRVPKDHLTKNLIGHFHYMLGLSWEGRDWTRAFVELRAAELAAPQNDVLHYNLGLVYYRNGLVEESLRAFDRSNAINPRAVLGTANVRASERVAEVRAELEAFEAQEKDWASRWGVADVSAVGAVSAVSERSAEVHLRLAEAWEREGNARRARGHRLQALIKGRVGR